MDKVKMSFGEVIIYKTAIHSGTLRSLDSVHVLGWLKGDSTYSVKRENGLRNVMLFFTVSGEGVIKIRDAEYCVKSGEVALLPANTEHYYACKNTEWEFYWLEYFGDNADLTTEDITRNGQYVFDLGVNSINYLLKPLLKDDKVGISSEIEESECVRKILFEILSVSIMGKALDDSISHQILEQIDKLSDNEELSISAIAQSFHYSKEHLIRLFEQVMGVSPYKYWLTKKMKKSSIELVEGRFSIGEIATKYGYSSVSSYSKQFKKVFSVSPQQWRENVIFGNN